MILLQSNVSKKLQGAPTYIGENLGPLAALAAFKVEMANQKLAAGEVPASKVAEASSHSCQHGSGCHVTGNTSNVAL